MIQSTRLINTSGLECSLDIHFAILTRIVNIGMCVLVLLCTVLTPAASKQCLPLWLLGQATRFQAVVALVANNKEHVVKTCSRNHELWLADLPVDVVQAWGRNAKQMFNKLPCVYYLTELVISSCLLVQFKPRGSIKLQGLCSLASLFPSLSRIVSSVLLFLFVFY